MTKQDPRTVAQWTSPELAHHIEVMKKREDWRFWGNVVKNEAGWGQTHLEVFLVAMFLAHGQSTDRTPLNKRQAQAVHTTGNWHLLPPHSLLLRWFLM